MDATEPGRLLAERYRLTTVIGRGGMGTVWQGRDELLNRDVAVKEILWPPHLTESEQRLACRRAVREAQMAGRLSHRNVVRIFDIVEDGGHPCIVMEYLPYRSLRDVVLEDGPLPPDRAAEIGLGVLAALRAAHEEGILHRDVKPANVLICPDGRVVLTDFGIARAADSTTLTAGGTLLGSPSYIAPERARGGAGAAGTPGDLWGLGASLYAAVEGHPPFEGNGALATLTAVVADEPEPSSQAGPLWPVIEGLLRKDPDQRLDADETGRMLREVVAGDVAGEPESTAPSARLSRLSRRSRRPLVALALVALAAAGATALAFSLIGSPRQPAAAPAGSTRSAAPAGSTHSAAPPSASAPETPPSATSPRPSGSSSASPATGAAGRRSSPASPAAGSGPSVVSAATPAGYHRFTNSTGFSIAVPDGWLISHVGHYVYVNDPSDGNIFLLIDQSDTPNPNPLADWKQQQANRAATYPGYHLIRLQPVSYPQAEKAADWEFTYSRSGLPVHILNRNVLANARHAYALYWSTPASDWGADYHYFQTFAATFRPASA